MHPKLTKRLEWIGKCASIAGGSFFHFDHLKQNNSIYFLRVDSISGPIQYPWGVGIGTIQLHRPACYFLGSYANLWDPTHRQIIPAHMMGSVKVQTILGPGTVPIPSLKDIVATGVHAMGATPGIGGLTLAESETKELNDILQTYPRQELEQYAWADTLSAQEKEARGEAWNKTMEAIKSDLSGLSVFYKEKDLRDYFIQNFALLDRVKRYNDCKAQKFPPKVRPPAIPTPKPKAPPDWPGPTPEPPQPETGAKPEDLSLTLNFGPVADHTDPTLDLWTWLELPTA